MSEDLFEKLHVLLTKELLSRIKDGTASSADLSVARQLLKDNGINADLSNSEHPMIEFIEDLPFEEEGH